MHDDPPLDDLPQSEEDWDAVKVLQRVRDKTGWEPQVKVSADGSVTVSFATTLRATPPEAPKKVRRSNTELRESDRAGMAIEREAQRIQDLVDRAGVPPAGMAIEREAQRIQDLVDRAGQPSAVMADRETQRIQDLLDRIGQSRELEAALWVGGVSAARDLALLKRSLLH